MLYEFQEPSQYDQFISKYITGDFSTIDMEFFIPEIKKIPEGGIYLEIGVKYGKSLAVACLAAKENVSIVGVDCCDFEERKRFFKETHLEEKVIFINGESTKVSRIWGKSIDVLFIDGDHSYEGVNADIKSWAKFVKRGGVILFHDCDETSPGVMRSVNEHFAGRVELFKKPNKNTSLAKVVI